MLDIIVTLKIQTRFVVLLKKAENSVKNYARLNFLEHVERKLILIVGMAEQYINTLSDGKRLVTTTEGKIKIYP
ncbi:MAG: hypothetical protein J6S61_05440 [Elusimicrobiaceae bacterium]|nr:hypothetical protein [Elusimicrobiaceae bacterium]